jgi:sec-independent protein translocase protein TatA
MGLDNPLHIAFLLILVLLVFGAKRLPELGRSLGSGMRGFRDSLSGDTSSAFSSAEPSAPAPTTPAAATPIADQTGDIAAPVAAPPVPHA